MYTHTTIFLCLQKLQALFTKVKMLERTHVSEAESIATFSLGVLSQALSLCFHVAKSRLVRHTRKFTLFVDRSAEF